MSFDRRSFLAASAAAAALPSRLIAANGPLLTPEQFGARGDGVTNDTAAFGRLSAEVSRRGGGTISLRAGRTYLVGSQARGGPKFGWTPDPIIELHNLTRPLTIAGNGARLRCQPGLRFGTFDLATGQPVERPMPNRDKSEIAFPYRGMIWILSSTAPIAIRDLELDGNAARLRVGGPFGDKGWQVPATGLLLQFNSEAETIDNVLTHHHGLDGAMIVGIEQRSARSRVTRLVSRYNYRQGLSITGGRGYDFFDCEFSHTGRGGIKSPPGAGVDIEAEGHRLIRDLSFTRCKFLDNAGCGLVADSGNSEGARFTDCTFVGTTSWSAWPKKPGFSFANCLFVGSVVHAFPDPDPARAAHFLHCRFTDDPRLSPTGQVYSGGGPIVNMAKSDNVLFDGCTFNLVGAAVLPWSGNAIYKDCVMAQRSPKPAITRGHFLGRTTISGPVDLGSSTVEGTLIVNGRQVPRGLNR